MTTPVGKIICETNDVVNINQVFREQNNDKVSYYTERDGIKHDQTKTVNELKQHSTSYRIGDCSIRLSYIPQ